MNIREVLTTVGVCALLLLTMSTKAAICKFEPSFDLLPFDNTNVTKGRLGGLAVQVTKTDEGGVAIRELSDFERRNLDQLPNLDSYLLEGVDANIEDYADDGCVGYFTLPNSNALSLHIDTRGDKSLGWLYEHGSHIIGSGFEVTLRQQSGGFSPIRTPLPNTCFCRKTTDRMGACKYECSEAIMVEEEGELPVYDTQKWITKRCDIPFHCEPYQPPPRPTTPPAPVPN